MKVFVQQISTELFLSDDAKWVTPRERARAFEDAASAIEFSVKHGRRDVQLVMVSDAGEMNGFLQPFGVNDPELQSSGLRGDVRSGEEEKRRLSESAEKDPK